MSIMVEYDLPEWCAGCKRLDTVMNTIRSDNGITCLHLETCKIMRKQWNLSNEVYKPKGAR